MARSSPMVPERKMKGTPDASARAMASADMPSKAGRLKSERMRSGSSARSAARISSSFTTHRNVHVYPARSEEHTSELQSRVDLVCRLLLEKKKRCTEIRAHNK